MNPYQKLKNAFNHYVTACFERKKVLGWHYAKAAIPGAIAWLPPTVQAADKLGFTTVVSVDEDGTIHFDFHAKIPPRPQICY
jgi:hypothetical protein